MSERGVRAGLPDGTASRAVLIGVYAYESLDDLPAVRANLVGLQAALTNEELSELPAEHCVVLEQPANARVVLDQVRDSARQATDTLVVYFAGHGAPDRVSGELCLALPDSDPEFAYTMLRYDDIRRLVLDPSVRARRKVVILDCCYSGRALSGWMDAERVADQTMVEGSCVLTASAETRKAVAPPGERYTAFSAELIRTLSDGVVGGPELLDMETVYGQVRRALEAKTRPVPQQRNRNTGGLITLVRNAAYARHRSDAATEAHERAQVVQPGNGTFISPVVTPHQLPPAPHFISGRVAELAALDAAVVTGSDGDGPAVVVLTGAGGVGKTALALRWLQQVSDRFPHGQLYADLSAFGPTGPNAPEDILGRFLRSLGVAGPAIPVDLVERIALFRSVTAGKALAVLLDDAASSEQVRGLLPASLASVVVVTSRWRLGGLALVGASILSLEPLDATSAVRLLEKAVGGGRVAAEPTAAHEVASLCGGMPIALRVVAARLAIHPHWRLSGLAKELADTTRRFSALSVEDSGHVEGAGSRGVSVAASLDLSYRALPPEAARMYRLLALHPGTEFSTDVASAATGLPPQRAEELLDLLIRGNLILDIARNRCRFHDLFRIHAQQLATTHDSDTDRSTAVRAMVEWYLSFAVAADLVAAPLRARVGDHYQRQGLAGTSAALPHRFDNREQALDALEQELTNLVAAMDTAVEHGWPELVWQLAEALWPTFLYRGHTPEWITTYETGARAAAECGNLAAESRMWARLAAAYLRLKQPDLAEEFSQRAWQRARRADDWDTESTALESLGRAAHAQGRLTDAIEHYRRSLALNDLHGRVRGSALLLCCLGYAFRDIGDDTAAVDALHHSVELAQSIGDQHSQAQAIVAIGSVQARQGHLEQAISTMRDGLTMLNETEVPALRVSVLEQLGELSQRANNHEAARRYWTQAVQLYARLGDPRAIRLQEALRDLGGPPINTA